MKDRHKCEVMWLAHLLYVIVYSGVSYPSEEERLKWLNFAFDAISEPVNNDAGYVKERLRRRVLRMSEATIKPACKVSKASKLILVGYYIMNRLMDSGYLIIPDNSKMMQVVEHLLGLVDIEDFGVQKQMVSAKKQANKWLEKLQRMGYYRG